MTSPCPCPPGTGGGNLRGYSAGWSLYVTGGRPAFYDNFFDEAKARGWTVVSMKDEWKIIFPVAAG